MIIVGLTGRAGAGKGVVADRLVAKHGFTKMSFAAPLKKMLRTLDPVLSDNPDDRYSPPSTIKLSKALELFDGDESKLKASSWGGEYRRLLQVLGTDCIRALDEDFWVRAAMKQLTDPDGRYVFDDVRFPNEADAVRHALRAPQHLWYVKRPNYDGGAGVHASEQHAGRMGETLHIVNDSSITSLHALVDYKMERVFGDAT